MIPTVSIIIPTLNNISGLKYLLSYFKDKRYQVIVVDNDPRHEKNGYIAILLNCYGKRLIYLPQKRNLGFAKAVNLGAKYVKTKWMMILNDDVEFQVKNEKLKVKSYSSKLKIKQNPIDQLINIAEEKNLDALSPILINPDGSVENYGYKVLPYGKVELIRNFNNQIPNSKQILNSKFKIPNSKIDGLTAACLLIRSKVFKKLGGFDEKFFAYLEDVEFFLRLSLDSFHSLGVAQDKSFGIAYDIEVLHNQMTTAKTMGSFKAKQDLINWWRLYFAHPDKFKFDLRFIIERLRNVWGLLKSL
jgi:GT2 family glycosyltransferase